MKRKSLPKNKHKGIFIYCSKCKKYFSYTKKKIENKVVEPTCGINKAKYSSCKYPEKHKYKVRIHVPGTFKGVTGKVLSAKNYEEAVIEAIEFNNLTIGNESHSNNKKNFKAPSQRIYLLAAQVKYVDFLADVDVPEHKKAHRSKDNINTYVRSLKYFNQVLEEKGINTRLLPLDLLDEKHVGFYHQYLESNFGERSYNRHMNNLKNFFKWYITNYDQNKENIFEVRNKTVTANKETISGIEFTKLLSIITPERGISISKKAKVKSKRNFYAPFLREGFLLALHTGGRREEVVQLKWDMIKEINNRPMYIEVANLKVERMKKSEGKGKVAPKIIPVTKGLLDLINNLGYEENKGSSNYILCPNREQYKTTTIIEKLSKGFSHYYKQIGADRQLQFKCLRKTYLTYLEQVTKGATKKLSSHASEDVLHKHYIDERVVSKAVQEVQIFG